VHDAVPPLAHLVASEEPLFDGGPVGSGSVVVLADFIEPPPEGVLAVGTVGFLPAEADDTVAASIRRARVFVGYAGWGPGQLEGELEQDTWVMAEAMPDDVFHGRPERLWDDVLRRLGRHYDLLRSMPRDPTMN
jgi:putative transcriptional regulator